jgi:DeoR family transcriptional regulator, fructose operon transcriptional repressor
VRKIVFTERQQQIIAYLRQYGTATLQQLVDFTQASESSVRRDLTELDKGQHIDRFHGGATLRNPLLGEKSLLEKSDEALSDKQAIMKKAAEQIRYGECIYLDAGSTVVHLIPYLANKNIRVVTNGLMHVPLLIEQKIETVFIGGQVKMKTQAVIGAKAIQQLQDYTFDRAFIGANGFSLEQGYTTADIEEATLKQLAIQHAKQAYVVADCSKWSLRQFAKFGQLQDAILITTGLSNDVVETIQQKTEVLLA